MTSMVRKLRQSILINSRSYARKQYDLDNLTAVMMLCMCGGFIYLALEPII